MTKSIDKARQGYVFIKGNIGDKQGSWIKPDNILVDDVNLSDILKRLIQAEMQVAIHKLEVKELNDSLLNANERIGKLELLVKETNIRIENVVKGVLSR